MGRGVILEVPDGIVGHVHARNGQIALGNDNVFAKDDRDGVDIAPGKRVELCAAGWQSVAQPRHARLAQASRIEVVEEGVTPGGALDNDVEGFGVRAPLVISVDAARLSEWDSSMARPLPIELPGIT
jgi:hypothetical protein